MRAKISFHRSHRQARQLLWCLRWNSRRVFLDNLNVSVDSSPNEEVILLAIVSVDLRRSLHHAEEERGQERVSDWFRWSVESSRRHSYWTSSIGDVSDDILEWSAREVPWSDEEQLWKYSPDEYWPLCIRCHAQNWSLQKKRSINTVVKKWHSLPSSRFSLWRKISCLERFRLIARSSIVFGTAMLISLLQRNESRSWTLHRYECIPEKNTILTTLVERLRILRIDGVSPQIQMSIIDQQSKERNRWLRMRMTARAYWLIQLAVQTRSSTKTLW